MTQPPDRQDWRRRFRSGARRTYKIALSPVFGAACIVAAVYLGGIQGGRIDDRVTAGQQRGDVRFCASAEADILQLTSTVRFYDQLIPLFAGSPDPGVRGVVPSFIDNRDATRAALRGKETLVHDLRCPQPPPGSVPSSPGPVTH